MVEKLNIQMLEIWNKIQKCWKYSVGQAASVQREILPTKGVFTSM